MKIMQISPHIWSLKSWFLIPFHVWVVKGKTGVTLVDAGVPFMAKRILEFVDSLDGGPLEQILLTHGHGDHVGAIRQIMADRPVPIYAHSVEIPYLEGRMPYPRRRKAEVGVAPGIVQPLRFAQGEDLEMVAGLRPFLTPGHSPGHVVYYHEEDQVLLAGDLFTSRRGKLRPPMAMFTADMAQARRSGEIVQRLRPQRLEVCHGGPVLSPADQWAAYSATV